MKKKIRLLLLAFVVAFSFSGCKKESNVLKIGASPTPHAVILEYVAPLLKEEGYKLKIVEFQDYVLPNEALWSGEIKANFFQHIPYLNKYNKQNNTNFVSAGGIHIEPIGIYSKNHTSLENIPNGTKVIMSDSVSDYGRLLALLVEKGLIEVDSNVNLFEDEISYVEDVIVSNPKGLVFINDIAPGLLVTTYENEKNALVLINTNYALDGGLNPLEDALALESSSQDNPYVNVIAVKPENIDDPAIKALARILQSVEVQTWIEEYFEGAVIPSLAD